MKLKKKKKTLNQPNKTKQKNCKALACEDKLEIIQNELFYRNCFLMVRMAYLLECLILG